MYDIAVCDDEETFRAALQSSLLRIAEKELKEPPAITLYASGAELLNDIEQVRDLYLLDIVLPDKSGMELAETIRGHHPDACIVFISSHEELVFSSLRYAPFRFVRKEKLDDDLEEAFLAFLQKENSAPVLTLHTTDGEQLVRAASLRYVETSGHYLQFHAGAHRYKVRGKLSEYSDRLAAYDILTVSQSYAVNLRFVLSYQDDTVCLTGGEHFSVSRSLRTRFQTAFFSYQRSAYHADFL